MNSVLWLLNTVGVNSIGIGGVACISGICALGATACRLQFDSIKAEQKQERVKKNFEKMDSKKKEIAVNLFNEGQYKQNEQVKLNYDQMIVDKKAREINNDRIIDSRSEKIDYKGIKVDNFKQLLLGYNIKGNPTYGEDVNYVITGATRCGKTRKNHCILLNYLANKQGTVWICDLKMTDFKLFKGKRNVEGYVNNIESVKEMVVGFENEFMRRQEIFDSGNYIDLDDYNQQNHKNQMRGFMLYIEEFANLSDEYTVNGKPVGVYKDVIRLARTVGYVGGRIIMTTQRSSVNVITGVLKANCSFIGMKCLDGTNSKISIDSEGCERLRKAEALSVIDGNLTKIFSYNITDEMLRSYTNKLK